MKKILKLQCNTCDRTIDKIIDLTHYQTDKCDITLGCVGRLYPLQYKNSADIATSPEVGITDWRPRGARAILANELVSDNYISLSTGANNQITLGVMMDDPGVGARISVPILVSDSVPKTFRQYSFIKDQNFSTVSGVESGLEKKTLRFAIDGPDPDQVEVFVNGVKKEQGNDPDQFTVGTSSPSSNVPPNTIKFNTEIDISSRTQIDIAVSKVGETEMSYLYFFRNDSQSERSGAWEGISYAEKFNEGTSNWQQLILFSCDVKNLISIPLNSLFTLGYVLQTDTSAIPLSAGYFLLALDPFSNVDRCHNVVIPLSTISERDHLKFYVDANKKVIKIVSSAVQPIYPLLRTPPSSKFEGVKRITTSIPGTRSDESFDGNIVIGPDE